jgi:hypothetical protein
VSPRLWVLRRWAHLGAPWRDTADTSENFHLHKTAVSAVSRPHGRKSVLELI